MFELRVELSWVPRLLVLRLFSLSLTPSFHVCIYLQHHSWSWFCLLSWSAGGIIRVKFSIKMLPDVLLIAEVNILPALGKIRSSCAAKALEAQGRGEKEARMQVGRWVS